LARVLIIAYGNPLRSDDGLAWRLADDLSQHDLPDDVEIIIRHQLTPELASDVSQASTVLFVDAAQTGIPGEIVAASIKPEFQPSSFTHDCSPGGMLSVTQKLYGKCPEAFAISLCGVCFDHGERLSAIVAENLPRLTAQVVKFIARKENPNSRLAQ
jgi:hydrogenase maturation protease